MLSIHDDVTVSMEYNDKDTSTIEQFSDFGVDILTEIDGFETAMKLFERESNKLKFRQNQLEVLRMIVMDKQCLLLGAKTNFGKSLCILVPAFCSSQHILGWGNRNILCVVPNVIVLDTLKDMISEFGGITYCTPGHGKDKPKNSEYSLSSASIVTIWTTSRVSCFFQGQLHKKKISASTLRSRIRQFQEKFSNGLVVWEECHGPVVDRFAECKAAPRLIKEVKVIQRNA